MDVMEAIYNRRSVRAYTDQPVDKTTVEALIKAATHASSSMNEQQARNSQGGLPS